MPVRVFVLGRLPELLNPSSRPCWGRFLKRAGFRSGSLARFARLERAGRSGAPHASKHRLEACYIAPWLGHSGHADTPCRAFSLLGPNCPESNVP